MPSQRCFFMFRHQFLSFWGRRAAAVPVQGGLGDPGELFWCQDLSARADKARVRHPPLSAASKGAAPTPRRLSKASPRWAFSGPLSGMFLLLFTSCFKGGIALFSHVSRLTKSGLNALLPTGFSLGLLQLLPGSLGSLSTPPWSWGSPLLDPFRAEFTPLPLK